MDAGARRLNRVVLFRFSRATGFFVSPIGFVILLIHVNIAVHVEFAEAIRAPLRRPSPIRPIRRRKQAGYRAFTNATYSIELGGVALSTHEVAQKNKVVDGEAG